MGEQLSPGYPKEYKPRFRLPTVDETRSAIGIGLVGASQYVGQEWIKFIYEPHHQTLLGRIAYNGGNFSVGLATAFGVKTLLDMSGVNIAEKWKYTVSTVTSAATIGLMETARLPIPFFDTPERADLPAGLIGIGCYLGINLWVNRTEIFDRSVL